MRYVEQNCIFEHKGRKFESGSAVVTPEYATAYVGKPLNDSTSCRALTDRHGNRIGVCFLSSSWYVRSFIGNRMYQIYAIVDGIKYTGRGFGEGMSVNLRRCKKQ